MYAHARTLVLLHVASDAPQVQREKGAALRLQCWQRLITSKKLLGLLILNKKMREVRERNAAKLIQQVLTVILHRPLCLPTVLSVISCGCKGQATLARPSCLSLWAWDLLAERKKNKLVPSCTAPCEHQTNKKFAKTFVTCVETKSAKTLILSALDTVFKRGIQHGVRWSLVCKEKSAR